MTGKARGRRNLRCAATLTAILAVATMAACSSGSSGSGPAHSSSSAAPSMNTNMADVQAEVDKAFLTRVGVSTLNPAIQQAFKIAAAPLSAAKEALALQCWKSNDCTVPGGGHITVGIADGFGGNAWRQYSKMEAILQALAYPSVGKIMYLDANGVLSQMQANVRSLVAQGAKIIVTYDDFGAAMTPTFAFAQRSGAKVATYASPVPGATSAQVAVQVIPDLCALGTAEADAAAKAIGGSGDVAYFNGTPGNPQGQAWNKCASAEFAAKYPKIKVATSLNTDWTPDGAYKAASALIATGDPVKAILYDYADPMTQIFDAYKQAGKTPPAFITWTVNNALNKVYAQAQGTALAFPLVYTNGTNWTARVAVTAAMDALNGTTVTAQLIYPQPFVRATAQSWIKNEPGTFVVSTLIPASLLKQMN
jgi:ABC-type sugar transport system substrate-binding protein